MVFRRRTSDGTAPEAGADTGVDTTVDTDVDTDAGTDAGPDDTGAAADRSGGPWDVTEIEDAGERIDLGSLLVRGRPGLTLQAQVDEKTGRVNLITLVLGEGAVQVQAFAAPRTSGIWGEVRRTLMTSITGAGGLVEEVPGRFGPELRARVPGQGGALQPARFIGVDGPRWFLRGLFLGAAADPAKATELEDVFADIIVVRGQEAMAPSEPLTLTLPTGDPTAPPIEPGDAPEEGASQS